MKKRASGSGNRSSQQYFLSRMSELTSPKTRSRTEPLARWAEKRIRLDGRPFSFAGHNYLRAIYDDPSPHIVISKAAQVGGTVYALLRSFHANLSGLNVIYMFPTRSDVIDFSKSRVSPLLAENPFLSKLMTDTDTAGLKKIGNAHLYFRGMQSSVGLKSVPADMLVFDELDEAEPAAKAMAKERLAHSSYKRIIELSNPSLPDYGIDESFQRSDQRHWTMKCPGCNEWTALDKVFPQKQGQEVKILIPRADGTVYRACPKCAHELDTEQGEWVADFPSRSIRGYLISQLFSSTVEPAEILEEYRTTHYADRFYNLKIGIPWADVSRRLDAAFVLSHCTDESMAEIGSARKYVTMGVDTGKQLHVVILEEGDYPDHQRWKLIHLAICHEFSELDALLHRFRVGRCVIDGLPETHATREFVKRNNWTSFMCFFNDNVRGEAKWDEAVRTVQLSRTEALDASRAAVRDGNLLLPRRTPLVEKFAQHMSCDAKTLDVDPETGVQKYRYIKTGENHFSFAFTYAWLAGTGRDGVIRSVEDIPDLGDWHFGDGGLSADGHPLPSWEDFRRY